MPKQLPPSLFVEKFRDAAPYIYSFRKKVFVIYFSSDLLVDNQFPSIIHDISLLHSLGVRLVLVHGSRKQIESRLQATHSKSLLQDDLRVTDANEIQMIKEISGSIRFDIESLFSANLVSASMGSGTQINIVSGNFVTAKPLGIIDGVDFQHTGIVRKIDSDAIYHSLNDNDLVLLSPLGFSPTGEIFNLNSEDLATECAIALQADKLIFITSLDGICEANGQLINELTQNDLQNKINKQELLPGLEQHYQRVINACRQGVSRTHIINQDIDGALLLELFTNDGIGTLITADSLEDIHRATIEDVNGVLELIEPLEKQGVLVKRSREMLEIEIHNFFVIKRENSIIACGALYPFEENNSGELACLAVSTKYAGQGRGNKLFDHICQVAKKSGIKSLYTLTTQTSHWFIERGFKKTSLDSLPVTRQVVYNYQRNSAVYIKSL